MNHTLEIDSVTLEFREKRILQDVYVKIETGKITGLLGRNGSGKSCLMNIIFGELRPKDKSVRIDGCSILNSQKNHKKIKYLTQFSFIPKNFKIERIFDDFNIDLSDFINDFPDLEQFRNAKFRNLSHGEQRIIEIYIIVVSILITVINCASQFNIID
jgi:ABC-type multidrug transport system ATPase subunit